MKHDIQPIKLRYSPQNATIYSILL